MKNALLLPVEKRGKGKEKLKYKCSEQIWTIFFYLFQIMRQQYYIYNSLNDNNV